LNKSKSETYIGKHLSRQLQKYANTQEKVFLNPEFVVFRTRRRYKTRKRRKRI